MRFNTLLRPAAEDLDACYSKSSYSYKYLVQLTIKHARPTSTNFGFLRHVLEDFLRARDMRFYDPTVQLNLVAMRVIGTD